MLPLRHYLDPRERTEAQANPINDAVNIPLSKLSELAHALPERGKTVIVTAEEPLLSHTIQKLKELGRQAEPNHSDVQPASESEAVGRLWQPNRFLEQELAEFKPGTPLCSPRSPFTASRCPLRALDLACGTGRDAVFLASCGWKVVAVDILPDAIAKAQALAEASGIASDLTLQTADVALPDFSPGKFDLIFSAFFLHRPLFAKFSEWLMPGGSVIVETFTATHREKVGKPKSDNHVLQAQELRSLLEENGLTVQHYDEGWHEDRHTARARAATPLPHFGS